MIEDTTTSPEAIPNQSLRVRVEARKTELESVLAGFEPADSSRHVVEEALGQVEGLLTGDLDAIPNVVAAQLARWLETSKHIGESHPAQPS